jgi:hypothetical protein
MRRHPLVFTVSEMRREHEQEEQARDDDPHPDDPHRLKPRRHALDDNVAAMRFMLFCVALTACGGIIDTGDGGTTTGNDASTNSDSGVVKKDGSTNDVGVPPSCSPIQTATSIDANGGCQASASWSCGDTKYSAQCDCPSGQCSCSEQTSQGGGGFTQQEPSFCPACNPLEMPKLCGFPTN